MYVKTCLISALLFNGTFTIFNSGQFEITLRSNFAKTVAMLFHGLLATIFTASFLCSAAAVSKLPPFLKICHRNDANLDNCIRQSVYLLKPHLEHGILVLEVPAFEPLYVKEVDVSQSHGPIYVQAIYRNITVFGGTNFILKYLRYDLEKNRITLQLHLPHLTMRMNYLLNGKIMMVPINGNGLAHANLTAVSVIMSTQLERYENGETGDIHERVVNVDLDFDIGHASLHLENLFDGDNMLSSAMNIFLNENWEVLLTESKPKLIEVMADMVKTTMNQIFKKFPENVLLPP